MSGPCAPSVRLVLDARNDRVVWTLITAGCRGVRTDELHEVTTGDHGAARRSIVLEAVDTAVELAAGEQDLVDLTIYDASARNELLRHGDQFGVVQVTPRSAINFDDADYLAALDHIRVSLGYLSSASTSAPMTVATDGAFHPVYGGGAFGWMNAGGRFGFGRAEPSQVKSPLDAELYAILQALKSAHGGSTLHILTDSQNAVHAINTAGGTSPFIGDLASQTLGLVDRILDQRDRLTFTCSWVKGHVGHPLNDAADRLARMARTSEVYGTPHKARVQIARDIAAAALLPVGADRG